MKTPRFHFSIVMAAAIGTLLLIVTGAQAELSKRFGRFRASERDRIDLTSSDLRQHQSAKISGPARPVRVPPEYPRYQAHRPRHLRWAKRRCLGLLGAAEQSWRSYRSVGNSLS